MGEGGPLTRSSLLNSQRCPLPRWGEGTITTAALGLYASSRLAAFRLQHALCRGWEFCELVGRADGAAHQFAAAIGTFPFQHLLGAILAVGAFERAHHRVARLGRQVAIAAFAVRSQRQHA